MKNFYVITGGPGVGKTTLLEELSSQGYEFIPEIARELIKEQVENGGEALPWKNKELYKEIMFERSISSFEQVEENLRTRKMPIFFDRGFLDSIGYADLIQLEISERMNDYAKNWRYNETVFILPPWQEIYKTDSERKQDWEEAVVTFDQMRETYERYGYNIVEIPKVAVRERADFVMKFIEN
ncbi:AAA family ATPase [Fulvivirga sediminis]|uniref:AAA family ATPase n=1 Tax=Fulvivirga sediminis TaxID=2803949 RepID=UPI001F4230C4|nr:AAA family ATPase [Fulvivirga sediminis]